MKPQRPLRAAFLAGGALLLLAGGCKDARLGNSISPAQENQMGAQYAANVDSQAKLVMDGKTNRRILDIAAPIFVQAMKERTDVSYRIRVIDDPEVNAFSIPGGYIYLYRGLLDKLGNDDDAVACVIAHEASHVVRRHVAKQMSDAQGKGLLVDLASILSRSGAVNQIGGTLFQLDQLHFSRNDEYEADRWGERFAYNAGYDPAGMIRTFHILEDLERKNGGTPPAYALDHPVSRNRALRALEQLRELRANHGQYMTTVYDPTGDRDAARKNDLSYPALVLATTPAQPINTLPADTDKPDQGQKTEPTQAPASGAPAPATSPPAPATSTPVPAPPAPGGSVPGTSVPGTLRAPASPSAPPLPPNFSEGNL